MCCQDVDVSLETCTDTSTELTKCLKFRKVKGEPVTIAAGVALQSRAAKSLTGLMDLSKMLKSFVVKVEK